MRRRDLLLAVDPAAGDHRRHRPRYAIMAGVEAIRQSDWLFSVFGGGDEVFVRPRPVVTSCS